VSKTDDERLQFWDRFVEFLRGPEGQALLYESGKRSAMHILPRLGIHPDTPSGLAETQKDFGFLRWLREQWERHCDRLVDMDKRVTAAVARLDEHERICTLRWQEVANGQKELHEAVGALTKALSMRTGAIYNRMWAAAAGLILALCGIIVFLATYGSPWAK
jgi:hypothetical protein